MRICYVKFFIAGALVVLGNSQHNFDVNWKYWKANLNDIEKCLHDFVLRWRVLEFAESRSRGIVNTYWLPCKTYADGGMGNNNNNNEKEESISWIFSYQSVSENNCGDQYSSPVSHRNELKKIKADSKIYQSISSFNDFRWINFFVSL